MFDSSTEPVRSQDEALRLQALRDLHILDTPAEEIFDETARLASAICGTPVGLVNLLDDGRQWFKAKVGISVVQMPRQGSFCDHTLGQNSPLVVEDASMDARFSTSPFVTGAPHIRFYAGMPINTTEGYTVGTLCVTDTVPHQLTTEQTDALTALGRQVSAQMELRAKMQLLADVLRQKERAETELRERTLLFSAFMDHSPTTAFIKDRDGRFLYYNRMFCERFAVSPTEWIGKSVFDLFPQEFAHAYHGLDMSVLNTGVSQVVDETSPGPGDTTLYWRTHKFCICEEGEAKLLGGISLDISEEREAALKLQRSHAQLAAANEELTELSFTDGLTALRNRRAFDERLARKIEGGVALSLILLDVDHFKQHNDAYGHSAGDEVLRTVGRLLVENARITDYVARFGGEEFAILLPRTAIRQAVRIAERLRAAVAEYPWPQGTVTISAGVVTRSAGLNSTSTLLEAADTALYRAKHQGRNRVEIAKLQPVLVESYKSVPRAS